MKRSAFSFPSRFENIDIADNIDRCGVERAVLCFADISNASKVINICQPLAAFFTASRFMMSAVIILIFAEIRRCYTVENTDVITSVAQSVCDIAA